MLTNARALCVWLCVPCARVCGCGRRERHFQPHLGEVRREDEQGGRGAAAVSTPAPKHGVLLCVPLTLCAVYMGRARVRVCVCVWPQGMPFPTSQGEGRREEEHRVEEARPPFLPRLKARCVFPFSVFKRACTCVVCLMCSSVCFLGL